MKTLIERWTSETPKFFRRIVGIGISVGATGVFILSIPVTLPTLVLPAIVITVANHMVITGGIAAMVAKFAKVDLPKDEDAK